MYDGDDVQTKLLSFPAAPCLKLATLKWRAKELCKQWRAASDKPPGSVKTLWAAQPASVQAGHWIKLLLTHCLVDGNQPLDLNG